MQIELKWWQGSTSNTGFLWPHPIVLPPGNLRSHHLNPLHSYLCSFRIHGHHYCSQGQLEHRLFFPFTGIWDCCDSSLESPVSSGFVVCAAYFWCGWTMVYSSTLLWKHMGLVQVRALCTVCTCFSLTPWATANRLGFFIYFEKGVDMNFLYTCASHTNFKNTYFNLSDQSFHTDYYSFIRVSVCMTPKGQAIFLI